MIRESSGDQPLPAPKVVKKQAKPSKPVNVDVPLEQKDDIAETVQEAIQDHVKQGDPPEDGHVNEGGYVTVRELTSAVRKAAEAVHETTQKKQVGTAKKIKFGLEGKFIHIKVGDKDNPADTGDVRDIEEKVTNLLDQYDVDCMVLVTHHAVEVIPVV